MTPDEDKPYDAGDPKDVRSAKRRSVRVAVERAALVRTMLATPEQRAFWWEIISGCGVFRSSSLSKGEMYFAAGERNVGLKLLAEIPTDLYKMMADEAQSAKENPDVS